MSNKYKVNFIAGVFFLCWLPYTITNLLSVCTENNINVHWDNTCEMLTFLSAALNPCLYSLLNRTFRQAFIKSYKKLNVYMTECCIRLRDNNKNSQASNVSKANSRASKIRPYNEDATVMSISKLEDGRPNV